MDGTDYGTLPSLSFLFSDFFSNLSRRKGASRRKKLLPIEDNTDKEKVWGSLFLAVTYLVWLAAQISPTGSYPSLAGFMLIIGFLLYSQLVLYPIWIDHIDPTVDVVGSLRWLYPLAPVMLLPLGLLWAANPSLSGSLVLPQMIIFLSSLDLVIFFENFPRLSRIGSPLLDSLFGGFSLAAVIFFLYLGFPAAISWEVPFIGTSTLVMTLLCAVFAFTQVPILTGNMYVDSFIFSYSAVILSRILFRGAQKVVQLSSGSATGRTFLLVALLATFTIRLLIYGGWGE